MVDVGAGTGRSALAVSRAYPSIDLTLIEPDEARDCDAIGSRLSGAAPTGEGEATKGSASILKKGFHEISIRFPQISPVFTWFHIVSQQGVPVQLLPAALSTDSAQLPGSAEGYDAVLALQAVRHVVAPAAHYAAKLGLRSVTGERRESMRAEYILYLQLKLSN